MKDSIVELKNKIETLKLKNFEIEQEYFDRLSKYSNVLKDLESKYQEAISAHSLSASKLKDSILLSWFKSVQSKS